MPTLDWIGKKAVINHDKQVPFHLLNEVPELSYGDKDSGNMLMTVTAAMPHIASTPAMALRTCGIIPSDTTACPFALSRNKSRDVFQDTK